MAIGASKAIFEAGLSVPNDISVLGFDGLEIAKFMHPSLSTIEQPYNDMGATIGVVILEQLIDNDESIHKILETSFFKGQTIKTINEVSHEIL